MKRFMRILLGKTRTSYADRSEWLVEEEKRQMQEVRDRIDRVAEQVQQLDRRQTPREPVS